MKIKVDTKLIDSVKFTTVPVNALDTKSREYFVKKAGVEHYRLLAYLVETYFRKTTVLDIGTYNGASALALSSEMSTKVYSFDLQNNSKCPQKSNITYISGDCMDKAYKEYFLNSSLILLDTLHDGTFERKFFDYLIKIKWEGLLVCDDIHLNQQMKQFWESISRTKYDVTKYGHVTGTGFVPIKIDLELEMR